MTTETRYQRIAREQRERQEARAARMAAASRKVSRTEDSRIANHIDGYDRDDLGESPDY